MGYSKIHAYVRCHRREQIEQALFNIGIKGFSFCRVKGAGEYVNLFRRNHLVEHIQFEVIVPEEKVDAAVEVIMNAASTNAPGDGLIAVMPIRRLYRIRDRTEVISESLQPP